MSSKTDLKSVELANDGRRACFLFYDLFDSEGSLASIVDMSTECEASAKRILKSLNNPPDCAITDVLSVRAKNCHKVIRLARATRYYVRHGKSSRAALAAFRLGQASYTLMLIQNRVGETLVAADNQAAGRRKGGKNRGLSSSVQRDIENKLMGLENWRQLSNARAAKYIHRKLVEADPLSSPSPRTIRKYLPKIKRILADAKQGPARLI
jgi:hypothetical protein